MFHTHLRGSGVATTFEAISADGCVETSGELAFAKTNTEGTYAIFAGSRTDHCAEGGPVDSYFLASGSVQLTTLGSVFARATGTLEAIPYSGDTSTPTTLEYSLVFVGNGPAQTQTSHFFSKEGGITVQYSINRERPATPSGSLRVDGDRATVTSARLVSFASGELVIVR